MQHTDQIIERDETERFQILKGVLHLLACESRLVNTFQSPVQRNTRSRLDFLLHLFSVLGGEEIERTAVISLTILVPKPPGCPVGHALNSGHIVEIWEILRAHFEQLTAIMDRFFGKRVELKQ